MTELEACKLTLKIWQDMLEEFPTYGLDRYSLKGECASRVGEFLFNCPCCEFAGIEEEIPRCWRCPMKNFWTKTEVKEHHCLASDSPYQLFRDSFIKSDIEEGIKGVIELCKKAIKYWEMNEND